MGMSAEDREALRQRAAGLREEVRSIVSARELAEQGLSQDMDDARLIAEVAALEEQKTNALERLEVVTVNADAATEIMEAAAAAQAETVSQNDPTGESPTGTPANDNLTPVLNDAEGGSN